jgi:pyrroline-5-carboxylate reductase
MGSAVLRSVLKAGLYPPERVHISSPVPSELRPFASEGCVTGHDNLAAVRAADIIILAVRPGQALQVLDEVAGAAAGKCVVSICAGVTVGSMKSRLHADTPAVRMMPGLPLAYGYGATVMASPDNVPERFVTAAKAIFECGGTVEVMDEDLIDAATALGGSAVAYFFRMAGVMTDWAAENGVPPGTALSIVSQTLAGASEMIRKSGQTPAELAKGVAVPGGMTEAAFKAFDRAGFDDALRAGMSACRDKGIELVRFS